MITIKDVAKQAGVAPSTVSRVISNSAAISHSTKEKVQKVMDDMGYIPNVSARRLVTQQSHTVGIILKTAAREMSQNPFFVDVLMSISKVCKDNNYSTIISTSIQPLELLNEVKQLVKSNAVDGFVLLYSKEDDPVMTYLESIDFPLVIIGRKLSPSSDQIYIDNDNRQAAYQLTDYLVQLGHTETVFIAENRGYAVSYDRIAGYKEACEKHNLAVKVYESEARADDIFKIIKVITSLPVMPTAIITSDSMTNLHVLSALYHFGLRVPDDIQTATFNDSFINEAACPPQTVVNINPESLGEEAGKSLMELLKSPRMLKRSITVPTSIIARESTQHLKERIV